MRVKVTKVFWNFELFLDEKVYRLLMLYIYATLYLLISKINQQIPTLLTF